MGSRTGQREKLKSDAFAVDTSVPGDHAQHPLLPESDPGQHEMEGRGQYQLLLRNPLDLTTKKSLAMGK